MSPRPGLSYYDYRFYAPDIGRWTTRDSLGEAGGMNLYAFVGNNPVNWVDPWGLVIDNTKGISPVYYKPEKGTIPQVVQPGEKYKGRHDGVIEPCTGEVYKTPGKYFYQDNVWIDENGNLHDVTDWFEGGKKDQSFREAYKDWEELFKKAGEIKEKIRQKDSTRPCGTSGEW